MINIKQAEIENAETVALLARVTYRESHGHYIEDKNKLFNYLNKNFSLEQVIEDFKKSNVAYDIIYYKNFPVGYSKLVLDAAHKYDLTKKKIRLERIYILQEFIHLKLGQPLLNHSLKKASALGFEDMWLSVYVKNDRAIRFYQKNGFHKVGRYDFMVDGKMYDNHVLAKNLTSNEQLTQEKHIPKSQDA